jgi:type I restriction enzyme M protein
MNTHADRVGLIWSIAELLRHDYKPSEYGKVILPFTLLRRLDCWLAPTKAKVLERAKAVPQGYCRPSARSQAVRADMKRRSNA